MPRGISRNEIILWLAVIITETYGMETFRLKIVTIGAFASYATILFLPLFRETVILPLTPKRSQ